MYCNLFSLFLKFNTFKIIINLSHYFSVLHTHLVTMCYLKRDNVVRKNTALEVKNKAKTQQINKNPVLHLDLLVMPFQDL